MTDINEHKRRDGSSQQPPGNSPGSLENLKFIPSNDRLTQLSREIVGGVSLNPTQKLELAYRALVILNRALETPDTIRENIKPLELLGRLVPEFTKRALSEISKSKNNSQELSDFALIVAGHLSSFLASVGVPEVASQLAPKILKFSAKIAGLGKLRNIESLGSIITNSNDKLSLAAKFGLYEGLRSYYQILATPSNTASYLKLEVQFGLRQIQIARDLDATRNSLPSFIKSPLEAPSFYDRAVSQLVTTAARVAIPGSNHSPDNNYAAADIYWRLANQILNYDGVRFKTHAVAFLGDRFRYATQTGDIGLILVAVDDFKEQADKLTQINPRKTVADDIFEVYSWQVRYLLEIIYTQEDSDGLTEANVSERELDKSQLSTTVKRLNHLINQKVAEELSSKDLLELASLNLDVAYFWAAEPINDKNLDIIMLIRYTQDLLCDWEEQGYTIDLIDNHDPAGLYSKFALNWARLTQLVFSLGENPLSEKDKRNLVARLRRLSAALEEIIQNQVDEDAKNRAITSRIEVLTGLALALATFNKGELSSGVDEIERAIELCTDNVDDIDQNLLRKVYSFAVVVYRLNDDVPKAQKIEELLDAEED